MEIVYPLLPSLDEPTPCHQQPRHPITREERPNQGGETYFCSRFFSVLMGERKFGRRHFSFTSTVRRAPPPPPPKGFLLKGTAILRGEGKKCPVANTVLHRALLHPLVFAKKIPFLLLRSENGAYLGVWEGDLFRSRGRYRPSILPPRDGPLR